eukprot:TRINITY_DN74_c0_g1_i7.p1 TRINITY_DN74_c0_g1~~TRINITY_DN74_c0_g1_i7.p1  ORF type:complete len:150 (+),score=32.39 TRINITY_DN74_c0_g1_i7:287-736(+)
MSSSSSSSSSSDKRKERRGKDKDGKVRRRRKGEEKEGEDGERKKKKEFKGVDPEDVSFDMKKWNAVAMWNWGNDVESCAICRNHIMELCIECQSNQTGDEEECKISWGQCQHAFHFHCIRRWLLTRDVCPLDNNPWGYAQTGARDQANK